MKTFKQFMSEAKLLKHQKTASGGIRITKGNREYFLYDIRIDSDTGKDQDPWVVRWDKDEYDTESERFSTKASALNFIKRHQLSEASEVTHGRFLVYLKKDGKEIKKHFNMFGSSHQEMQTKAEQHAKRIGDKSSTGHEYIKHVYRGPA